MAPTPPSPPARLPLAGAALVAFTLLSWASVPLFLRHFANLGLDPYSANASRYGISAAFWLPFLLIARRRGRLPVALFAAAIIPAAFNTLGQTFFAWGPTLLDPGFFSFVFRVQIVFVTLGAYLLFAAERSTLQSPRYWAGLAGVVAGSIGMIMLADDAPRGTWVGVAVAVASGALFAGYGLSVRYFVHRYPAITSFGVICQYTALGTLASLAITWSLGWAAPAAVLDFATRDVLLLVASAFIGIAISHVSYYASITRLGVAMTSGIIQLQPVVTAAASVLIFGERLAPGQWLLGFVGVAGAILMLTAGGRRPPRALAKAEAAAEEGGA